MASSLAACEAVFLRNLLTFLGVVLTGATLLHMDNTGAERVAKDHVLHNVAKTRRPSNDQESVDCLILEQQLNN